MDSAEVGGVTMTGGGKKFDKSSKGTRRRQRWRGEEIDGKEEEK